MLLAVFKNPLFKSCTAGPSRDHDHILVVGPQIPKSQDVFDLDGNQRHPVYTLQVRDGYPSLIPVSVCAGTSGAGVWVSASGAYAGKSDGRWTEIIRGITQGSGSSLVAIHDRAENDPDPDYPGRPAGLRELSGVFPQEVSA
tara:strand:+ start:103 stop:528 length:426 start_codon:yes stop_codon:yes gene_type:complete